MKPWTLLLLIATAVGLVWLVRRRADAAAESLREDKPAPTLPGSSDLLAGRPRVAAPFNLPTVIAGLAPAAQWNFDDVANIFASN